MITKFDAGGERITEEQFLILWNKAMHGNSNPDEAEKYKVEMALYDNERWLKGKEAELEQALDALTELHKSMKELKVEQTTLIKTYRKNFEEGK